MMPSCPAVSDFLRQWWTGALPARLLAVLSLGHRNLRDEDSRSYPYRLAMESRPEKVPIQGFVSLARLRMEKASAVS